MNQQTIHIEGNRMILWTPEVHVGGIILANKRQGIRRAKWWVCGKGHVTVIIADDCADHPTHGVGGSPFNFYEGASTINDLHDGADTPHRPHVLSNDKPDTCAFKCCTFGVGT